MKRNLKMDKRLATIRYLESIANWYENENSTFALQLHAGRTIQLDRQNLVVDRTCLVN